MTVAQLNLTHAQFSVTAAAAGVKPNRIPPLEQFIPEVHTEKPRTFEEWASVLLPLAGG